ncbi:MAG: CpXC domain-containing protein, partial [Deltaproteobacteria bacterium]|nr:CpXC domain-containing protein [Deltaproteobacteria bacterium]
MTAIYREDLECVLCGRRFEASIYSSINVSLDPSLKERLLGKEINVVQCPGCGERFTVGATLLYHDMERALWLWAIWGNEQEWAKEEARFKDMLNSYEVQYPGLARAVQGRETGSISRLAFGYDQLRETVLTFAAGLD